MDWKWKTISVLGGASFIGSHLTEALLERGARVLVVDNLSSGKREYLDQLIKEEKIKFREWDLASRSLAYRAVIDRDIVFHLAADHGGRGYVDRQQVATASNFALDQVVFHSCLTGKAKKLVFCSSGCVYPNYLQSDPNQEIYLTEDMAGPPLDCDGLYGYAKMMSEMTLRRMHLEHGFRSASARLFTVIGPRMKENHAICAMVARAFVKKNPYHIWGDGTAVRNWTWVGDIVDGLILAAEKIDDATAVNLGTMERTTVLDAAKLICKLMDHETTIYGLPKMPTGPLNRVADNSLAKRLLGWEPKVMFEEGVKKTIEWYVQNRDPAKVKAELDQALMER